MDSRGSVVQLEIVQSWQVWKGYLETYSWASCSGVWKRNDPTDRPSALYTATHAFPSLKPDVSVFGPPRRSRKQRGWYQIRLWPFAAAPSIDPEHAAGNDLPPELVQRVFEGVLADGPKTPENKQAFYACALVCRYWAQKFQKALWRNITLRSREDIFSLRAVLSEAPTSRVARYIIVLTLASTTGAEPWVHLLSILHPLLAPSGWTIIALQLAGKPPTALAAGRSIHAMLPHSLPQFSRRLWKLALTNLQFRSVDALLHLVWELPDLGVFHGEKLTWPQTRPLSRVYWQHGQRRKQGRGVEVQLKTCSDYWVAAWLSEVAVHPSFENQRYPQLTFDDRRRLADLIGLFENIRSDFAGLELRSPSLTGKHSGPLSREYSYQAFPEKSS